MKVFLLIVVIFLAGAAHGQTKAVNIPTYKNYKDEIDTSLWYKWKYELAKQINLKDLQISTDTFHFRFWTDIQSIDIWTTDHTSYSGMVTNYAQRFDDKILQKGTYKVGKVYYNQIPIDSAKAKQLFMIINKLSIITIPTDNEIKGWQPGLDGQEYLIETSSPTRYDFKTYWTPGLFSDSILEAKQIQSLVSYIYEDFGIDDYYKKLKLPAGHYQNNGIKGVEVKGYDQKTIATKVTELL